MNSNERISAIFEGKPTDRKAEILSLSLYGAGLTKCPLSKYYTDPQAYLHGQSAVLANFQTDMIFTPFALSLLAESFGSKIKFFNNQPPVVIQPAIKSADDFFESKYPNITKDPHQNYIRKSLQLMVKKFDGKVPVATISLSPIDLPSLIMGLDNWLETLLFNPELALKIIDYLSPQFINWINTLFEDGASCLILPLPFANIRIITPRVANEIVIPILTEILKKIKGKVILHHVGGKIMGSLDFLSKLPNIVGFCIDQSDSPEEAREHLDSSIAIIGNIDGPGLLNRNPDGIYRQTMAILQARKDDPTFILATSAADIDLHTPPDNIHAITRAVNDFSKRKL